MWITDNIGTNITCHLMERKEFNQFNGSGASTMRGPLMKRHWVCFGLTRKFFIEILKLFHRPVQVLNQLLTTTVTAR